ncbi:hypothetical protein GGI35DRAFT_126509 [Trichoderma velutinum]
MAFSFFSDGLHKDENYKFPIELTRARKGNEEERREYSRKALQHYEITPISTEDFLAKKTKKYLDRIWDNWLEYAKAVEADPDEIWVELCRGSHAAMACCRAFLKSYAEFSRVWRPCLGPEEWELVRTVNHAVTIEDVWSALVRNADTKVLQPKRDEEREKTGEYPATLELRYSSRDKSKHKSPAYTIAQWIPQLAKEIGLSRKQSFEKRETSPEDIIALLDVLWTRAKDIDCTPDVRVAFHSAILLAAIGGWRPACLLNIKYKDVELGWSRHLNRTHLVATITIHQNKQNENRIERTQRSTVRFTITTVPCSHICLVSLLASRAFADRAFEVETISLDQVLHPGPLERNVDYVPLKWKPEVLDKGTIIPIAYNTYHKLWTRTCFVAGLRDEDKMRPYAMRVGTGNRLDGSLTPAVRNYILDHSTDIHEKSYLPIHIKHDIQAIAFPGLTGENSVLISLQSSALLRRDQNAPVYITQDDLDKWENRRDITSLRKQYKEIKTVADRENVDRQKAKEASDIRSLIKSRIKYILDCLEKLRLQEMRQEYFQEADKLRALGLSTGHLSYKNATNPRKHTPVIGALVTLRIGHLLQKNVNPQVTITKVTAYLLRKPEKEIFKEEYETEPTEPQIVDVKSVIETRCLLCDHPYSNVSSLTRHVREHHEFKKPFNCPECLRNGDVHEVNGIPSAWSNHVLKFHGKNHTPNLRSQPETPAYCPICQKTFTANGFSAHYNRHQRSFTFPFNCHECLRQGKSDNAAIASPDDWILHVRHTHNGGRINGAILQTNISKKRPLEGEDLSSKRVRLESLQ